MWLAPTSKVTHPFLRRCWWISTGLGYESVLQKLWFLTFLTKVNTDSYPCFKLLQLRSLHRQRHLQSLWLIFSSWSRIFWQFATKSGQNATWGAARPRLHVPLRRFHSCGLGLRVNIRLFVLWNLGTRFTKMCCFYHEILTLNFQIQVFRRIFTCNPFSFSYTSWSVPVNGSLRTKTNWRSTTRWRRPAQWFSKYPWMGYSSGYWGHYRIGSPLILFESIIMDFKITGWSFI